MSVVLNLWRPRNILRSRHTGTQFRHHIHSRMTLLLPFCGEKACGDSGGRPCRRYQKRIIGLDSSDCCRFGRLGQRGGFSFDFFDDLIQPLLLES